ncbi:transglycosylase SLT domain-containing protein [Salmonella enterica subsp. enterica]|nr:transglycosylase SLT domain-containing protein [Salmonella enterica]
MRYQYVCLVCAMTFLSADAAEPPRASLQWRNEVIRTAREIWGLNAPVADFAGQLHQESGWAPDALSPAGAQGMAQFMPATAKWVSQLWKSVLAKNSCQRMAFTLSAYNGGQGWVNRDKKLAAAKGLDASIWFEHVERVNAGRSAANWRENRHYSKAILYQHASRYLQWGQASCIH